MFVMGEGHIFVEHIPLQVIGLVATLLETARITDLRVGHARPFSREEVSQRNLTIHPFAS